MADKTITDPTGAYGVTALQDKCWYLAAPYKASAAVTAKAVLAIGTDGSLAIAATNGTASLCVGIALAAVASGAAGQAIVHGVAQGVPATGAVAAGDLVKRSVTTAGSVSATATPAAGEVVGVAIAASASNIVDVWVTPGRGLS